MKNFFVSIVVASSYMILVFGLHGKLLEDVDRALKTCQADPKIRINDTLIKKIEDGKFVDITKMGPFLACYLTTLGILSKDGKIVHKKLYEYLGRVAIDPKMYYAILDCMEEKETLEETAINTMRCFLPNADFSRI